MTSDAVIVETAFNANSLFWLTVFSSAEIVFIKVCNTVEGVQWVLGLHRFSVASSSQFTLTFLRLYL